jgi:regulator of protease activity HflC (stomatin/prohibitin superfamily)
MVAMSQWRIVDPQLAVTRCAATMKEIREKVNQLVRATIARIVAGTNIGAGPVSGSMSRPVVQAQVLSSPADVPYPPSTPLPLQDNDLSHLMQSTVANRHMAELSSTMGRMGIEVVGVYVPEKRMKNDDIREQVARQAVIGIKADAERAAADAKAYATVAGARAEAEAKRQNADADAYAKVTSAKAEAEAVLLVSEAQAKAGAILGDPSTTASRIALTEKTASALQNSKVTIFAGAPSQLPFMLSSN